MKLRLWAPPLCLFTALLMGCKLGYNRSPRPADSGQKPPECATTAANTAINDNAQAVFQILANLTCYQSANNGNMFGQVLGSGTQIAEDENPKSYAALVTSMTEDYKATPVVIETDYALDDRYGYDELKETNDVLEQHWLDGGLVSISWSPINPWVTSEQTTDFVDLEDANLADLIDPSSDIYDTWMEYLSEVADALYNMQRRGIVVLWRPLPEMNDDRFWWGVQASVDTDGEPDATLYKDLWQHMFEYFQNRNLNNLLWVYSPVDGDSTVSEDATSATWAYPGEDYVDVVAPVVRADSLQISDYENLLELERPLAVASWGPSLTNSGSLSERFDAAAYSDRLIQSYPFVSYWLAPYSQELDDDQTSYQALVDLKEITGLTDSTEAISLEEALEVNLLSTRAAEFDTSTTISATGL